MPTVLGSLLPDVTHALPGAVVGAFVAVTVAEAVRWLRKPRAEWIAFRGGPEVEQRRISDFNSALAGEGVAYFHKVAFRVHGQPTGLAAARLTWIGPGGGPIRQYAKWDEQPEPIEAGQFQPSLLPSTFFLQLVDHPDLRRRVQVAEHAGSGRSDQADAGVVLRRPDDPSRGGADVLLVDVPVSRHAARSLLARAPRSVPEHLQRDHRLPARRRPPLGARAPEQLLAPSPPAQGNGRDGLRDQHRAHSLRHHRCARGGSPRSECGLRARRWGPQLPAAQVDRHHLHVRAHGPGAGEPEDRK